MHARVLNMRASQIWVAISVDLSKIEFRCCFTMTTVFSHNIILTGDQIKFYWDIFVSSALSFLLCISKSMRMFCGRLCEWNRCEHHVVQQRKKKDDHLEANAWSIFRCVITQHSQERSETDKWNYWNNKKSFALVMIDLKHWRPQNINKSV